MHSLCTSYFLTATVKIFSFTTIGKLQTIFSTVFNVSGKFYCKFPTASPVVAGSKSKLLFKSLNVSRRNSLGSRKLTASGKSGVVEIEEYSKLNKKAHNLIIWIWPHLIKLSYCTFFKNCFKPFVQLIFGGK